MKNPSTDAADARTYNQTFFVIERMELFTGDHLSGSPLFYHSPNMGHFDYYVKLNQEIKG
jgi:hypothetical protein